jgi:hypothetical protein
MQKKPWIILSLIFSLLLTSCQDKNPCNLSKEFFDDQATIDSIINLPDTSSYYIRWMDAYNEPSLFRAGKETYRFIWSSSFDGQEVDRIEESNGKYKVVKKVYVNRRDKVGITSEFEVSRDVWNTIVSTLAKGGFWTYKPVTDRPGFDGATWTLEGYKPVKDKCTSRNYHMVHRWSPNDSTFISMCNLFFELKEN